VGVCFVAYSLSDSHIEQCLAEPPLIWQVVEPENEGAYLRELEKSAKVSLLFRLLCGKTVTKPQARKLEFSAAELRVVDLDKSWDGVRACVAHCAPDAPDFLRKVEKSVGPMSATDQRSITAARPWARWREPGRTFPIRSCWQRCVPSIAAASIPEACGPNSTTSTTPT
jgi:hypothetical protein